MKIVASVVVLGLVVSVGAGCSAGDSAGDTANADTAECVSVESTDLTTQDGWLNLLATSPDTVGLTIDDGRGGTVAHRADAEQPLASAVKVAFLAAYVRAVAAGTVDSDEQVPVAEWERWYVPGTDGGAHPAALTRLGIANDVWGAADKSVTVRLDDMIGAMIQESDNAVPDYLRFRLGDAALVDAAAAGGWADFQPTTLAGSTLAMFDPALAEPDPWESAERWAFDPQFEAEVMASPAFQAFPAHDVLAERVERFGATGSADQLASLLRSFADGSFGAGSDIALRHLEWQPSPDDLGLGFKGGNLPGVLTMGFELRRTDGTVATAVWLTDGLGEDRYNQAISGLVAFQSLILDGMENSDVLGKIACAV